MTALAICVPEVLAESDIQCRVALIWFIWPMPILSKSCPVGRRRLTGEAYCRTCGSVTTKSNGKKGNEDGLGEGNEREETGTLVDPQNGGLATSYMVLI